MKKVLWTVTIVLILALAASAQDAEKKVNLYLGAGASLPMGDLGDRWNFGLHGAGAVGFVVAPGFQILGKVEYHTFGIDDQGLSGVDGGSFNAFMFGGAGRYNFPMENSKFSPFITGGIGMANAKISDLTIGTLTIEGDSDTKVYFEVGAGFDIGAGETMSIFFQGRYVSIQLEGSAASFIPFTVGLKF